MVSPDPAAPARPAVSVVIRARNEAAALPAVLAAIARQSLPAQEVVVVDSGSTDATVAIARAHGARVVPLAPERFTYGRGLNLGTQAARHDVVVYLSAHAEPASEHWLAELVAPLRDPQVGAVFGRQLPRRGCHPIDADELQRAYPDQAARYAGEAPFSNANAAVRRELALAHRFDEQVGYAEDRIWAATICAQGYEIVYAPRAAVLHSHDEGFAQVLARKRRETAVLVRHCGLRTSLRRAGLLPVAFAVGLARDMRRLCRAHAGLRAWLRAPGLRLARVLGVWLGCRDAQA